MAKFISWISEDTEIDGIVKAIKECEGQGEELRDVFLLEKGVTGSGERKLKPLISAREFKEEHSELF